MLWKKFGHYHYLWKEPRRRQGANFPRVLPEQIASQKERLLQRFFSFREDERKPLSGIWDSWEIFIAPNGQSTAAIKVLLRLYNFKLAKVILSSGKEKDQNSIYAACTSLNKMNKSSHCDVLSSCSSSREMEFWPRKICFWKHMHCSQEVVSLHYFLWTAQLIKAKSGQKDGFSLVSSFFIVPHFTKVFRNINGTILQYFYWNSDLL